MKVLLSAYQCGPGMGSVSQIGWEWYSRLARRLPVTLVTHVRNRKCLTEAGAPLPGTDVIYIDTEWFAAPLYRMASRLFRNSEHAVFLISSADFFMYDGAALRKLRRRRGEWKLVHAVTPVSPLAATRLHRLGIPLVVGPWNGGLQSPTTFPEIMSADSGWIYRIRSVARMFDRWFQCTSRAACILSATRATDESLPGVRTVRMMENGVDLDIFQPSAVTERAGAAREDGTLRVVYAGRLIPAKGVSMLLEAVSRVRSEIAITVTIIGDGPLRDSLQRESEAHGLTGIVRFTGALSLKEVASHMREADLFCLPSIRESGGAVLLESMACGVPVIAVNYGGPAEIVDDEVGRKLSADGSEALIRDLAKALADASRNRAEWKRKGRCGRSRAEGSFGWEARIDTAVQLYASLAEGNMAHV
jgi:glycosyltransferase involved in cell wall biosynthesis